MIPGISPKDVERFWGKIQKAESGCWLWTGTLRKDGYGQIRIGGRAYSAHRVAHFLLYGHVHGEVVRHTCDTPRCVHPMHLRAGTQADNMADKKAKGRQSRKGHRCARYKLGAKQFAEIRALSAAGETNRAIARRFGITPNYVSQIIHGTRGLRPRLVSA